MNIVFDNQYFLCHDLSTPCKQFLCSIIRRIDCDSKCNCEAEENRYRIATTNIVTDKGSAWRQFSTFPTDPLFCKQFIVTFLINRIVSYCKYYGRPANEPGLLFRLLFLQILYNLSDERIIQEAQVNPAYKWFIGINPEDSLPDARFGWKSSSKSFFGYKEHIAMTEEEIITALEVTPGSTDEGKQLLALLEQTTANGINVSEGFEYNKDADFVVCPAVVNAKRMVKLIEQKQPIPQVRIDCFFLL